MYKQNQTLVDLLGPAISAMGYEMWGVEYLPKGHASLLRVYIDSDAGITLADCERVSEQVTGLLDVNDPIRGSYHLEISSPGLDRPLFTIEQFQRYTGHQVRVKLRTKYQNRRNIGGEIIDVVNDIIILQDGEQQYEVQAGLIERANLAE